MLYKHTYCEELFVYFYLICLILTTFRYSSSKIYTWTYELPLKGTTQVCTTRDPRHRWTLERRNWEWFGRDSGICQGCTLENTQVELLNATIGLVDSKTSPSKVGKTGLQSPVGTICYDPLCRAWIQKRKTWKYDISHKVSDCEKGHNLKIEVPLKWVGWSKILPQKVNTEGQIPSPNIKGCVAFGINSYSFINHPSTIRHLSRYNPTQRCLALSRSLPSCHWHWLPIQWFSTRDRYANMLLWKTKFLIICSGHDFQRDRLRREERQKRNRNPVRRELYEPRRGPRVVSRNQLLFIQKKCY